MGQWDLGPVKNRACCDLTGIFCTTGLAVCTRGLPRCARNRLDRPRHWSPPRAATPPTRCCRPHSPPSPLPSERASSCCPPRRAPSSRSTTGCLFSSGASPSHASARGSSSIRALEWWWRPRCARRDPHALALQMQVHRLQHLPPRRSSSKQMAELADRRLVRHRLVPQVNAHELPHQERSQLAARPEQS